jgi:RNA polymerase sigma-70 factor (ECF subfamily)
MGVIGLAAREVADSTPDFDAVYERHLPFVWRSLLALGVPVDRLEDAAQDVFVVVHAKLAEFEGRSKMTTWLYAIARNIALEHIRHAARERQRDRPLDHGPDRTASPDEILRAREARRVLNELLARLAPQQREVFVLVELEMLAVKDVAQLLGIKENTTWSRLRLARRELERLAARMRARERGGAG